LLEFFILLIIRKKEQLLYLFKNSFKFFCITIILSCAAQGPASGGPKDLIGPVLKSISPSNGSSSIKKIDKIEIVFDELIDPLSVPAAISIIPNIDYKVKTRSKKILIFPEQPILEKNTLYRIKLSKSIRDYRGNNMISPINIVFTSSQNIFKNKILGKLNNINEKSNYNVALFNYPIKDSIKPELIVETDDFGNFEFNYLEPNDYVISALEGKIYNFNKQLRINRYGIMSDDYLSLKNKDVINDVEIYIDNPLEKIFIESIDIKNHKFGVLNFSNGSKENFIIPYKDKFNQIHYNVGDTILINLEKENHLERYITKDFKFILPEIIDTIAPKIISKKILNEKINIEFSEPLKNVNNLKEIDDSLKLKILGFSNRDSIKMEYTFMDPFTIRISNLDSINYIKLFQDNIKDINNNILLDSITIISINDLTKNENTSLDNLKTGSIMGTVDYYGNVPIILNAKNIENNLNFFAMVQNNKYEFNSLPSGKYILWGYESLNILDSTRYFSGIWNPYQRSSKFIIYPDTIEVRARWTIDELNMDFK